MPRYIQVHILFHAEATDLTRTKASPSHPFRRRCVARGKIVVCCFSLVVVRAERTWKAQHNIAKVNYLKNCTVFQLIQV